MLFFGNTKRFIGCKGSWQAVHWIFIGTWATIRAVARIHSQFKGVCSARVFSGLETCFYLHECSRGSGETGINSRTRRKQQPMPVPRASLWI